MEKRVSNGENPDPIGEHTLEIISGATRFNYWMYSEIKPFLKGNIIEIGSGIGNISKYIIKDKFPITLSDYNPQYCNQLEKIFSGDPVVQDILQIDLLVPHFQDKYSMLKEKFDTIILLNVIEHIENDSKAVENCRFMLKPGGHFIALAPAYQWLYCRLDKELGHYRRYSLQKMRDLVQEQLEVINARHFNFLGIFGWFVFGKIFRNKKLGNEMNSFDHLVFLARVLDKLTFKRIGLSVIVTGKKENPGK
jgi:2-polyprenyl-3-methyl-5-hydroxy-6-metoxy-1,4-benzoquinol methylase